MKYYITTIRQEVYAYVIEAENEDEALDKLHYSDGINEDTIEEKVSEIRAATDDEVHYHAKSMSKISLL